MAISTSSINYLRQNARSLVRELGLLNEAYFDIGVTLAERHLLIELSTNDSPTMGEIAERLLLDKSTISRLISKAVKKGYIECTTDTKDKRKRFLHLTNKGRKTLEAFEPIAFNQTKSALLTLTPSEINTVYDGIALYANGLKNCRLQQKIERAPTHQKIENLCDLQKRLTNMGYTLEPFEEKDKSQLYEIFKEVVDSGLQFPYESSSVQEFNRQFFAPGTQVYVCRTLDGQVVGGFYLRSNYPGCRSSHIANAAYMIKESYRGKGIGSLIIKASLHFAKDLGYHTMQFNMVLSKNVQAIKLYEKLGFSIVGTLPNAIRNLDGSYQDGYVMSRPLTI
ncbi:MAG: MarR family transcriptional regulator [Verrucomicrobia bacterium]|nr:MarR family transcriptional regulator [Verrucomicrobiota bacterium]